MPDNGRQLEAIILAAGQGTRMNSDLPKVLHEVADRPMVAWVVDAARRAGASRCVVVVGYKAELVREALADQPDVVFVEQAERLGTGHAAMMAQPLYADRDDCDVLVIAGDMPLLRSATLSRLVAAHRKQNAVGSMATGELDDPTGYGRILRDKRGAFIGIIEHKDATADERLICEVNPSCYCYRSKRLFDLLKRIRSDNAAGEYYITDTMRAILQAGEAVAVVKSMGDEEVQGINTPAQLAAVDAMMRRRPPESSDERETAEAQREARR